MRFIAIILLLISTSVASLFAQSPDPPRYEAAVGYQFTHDQDIAKQDPDLSANFPAGWLVSGGVRLAGALAAIGEVTTTSKTIDIPGDKPKVRVSTFMAGPRFAAGRHAGLSPFGQVLFGSARATTSLLSVSETVSHFSYQPGVGVDLNASGRFGIRIEGDYRVIRVSGHNSKEPRFVAAAVVGF
jgi:outer membrane protein with beta-barrel domain